jgi:hypothetical protein
LRPGCLLDLGGPLIPAKLMQDDGGRLALAVGLEGELSVDDLQELAVLRQNSSARL